MPLRTALVCAFTTLAVLAAAPDARADSFLTAYLGTMFDGRFDGADPGRKVHYGVGLGAQGGSGVGFELDLSYAPSFFSSRNDRLFDFRSQGNLVTLMGNLVVGRPRGAVRPYVSGGFGLMRSEVNGPADLFSFEKNGFGLNAGAGLRVGPGPIALRGDVRYFRQISDLGSFRNLELGTLWFWRGSVGLVLGF